MMDISEKDHLARIERLSRRSRGNRPATGTSSFVRMMRLILPLAAAVIVAALFALNGTSEDAIVPIKETAQKALPKAIVQNELTNPKFESRDKKNNPYQVTAARAVQGQDNKDLIMLEKPVGNMTMEKGKSVHIKANEGAFRQDTERFYLEGDVHIEHSDGYRLQSTEAHIDFKQSLAWTEKPVTGAGPDMNIEATGMKANVKTGEVLFTGPAKLTLSKGFKGF